MTKDLNDMRVILWETMSEAGVTKAQFNMDFWPSYVAAVRISGALRPRMGWTG